MIVRHSEYCKISMVLDVSIQGLCASPPLIAAPVDAHHRSGGPVVGTDTTAARATLRARERKTVMQQIILEAGAGQVSAEPSPRGVAADTRVHVLVEILDSAEPPMAAIAQAGKGFDWLADEPDLPDADLVERAGLVAPLGSIVLARFRSPISPATSAGRPWWSRATTTAAPRPCRLLHHVHAAHGP